jgi:hypothetical protein
MPVAMNVPTISASSSSAAPATSVGNRSGAIVVPAYMVEQL